MSNKILYRYSKKFKGIITNLGNKTNVILNYYVSPLKTPVEYDWKKIYIDLLEKKLIHPYRILNDIDYIMIFSIRKVTDFWL